MKINYRLTLILLFLLSWISNFYGQETAMKDKKSPSQPEIGITEHLNSFIPSGIKVIGVNNDTNDLKQLINKPTIIDFKSKAELKRAIVVGLENTDSLTSNNRSL